MDLYLNGSPNGSGGDAYCKSILVTPESKLFIEEQPAAANCEMYKGYLVNFNDYEYDILINNCFRCNSNSICDAYDGTVSKRSSLKTWIFYSSAGSLMFAGFFILLNKKFKKHPYPMIAWSCLIESINYLNII